LGFVLRYFSGKKIHYQFFIFANLSAVPYLLNPFSGDKIFKKSIVTPRSNFNCDKREVAFGPVILWIIARVN